MKKLEFRPTKILLVFWIIGIVIGCLPIGGTLVAVCLETNIPWQKTLAMGYLIPLAVFTTYAILFFNTIRYELDDRYVTKASGVLWKKRRSIPLEKITNIDIRQGPFERIFGYGKIWIFTPSTGMSTPEEKLVGIIKPHDMKQTIIERSETSKQPQASASQDTEVQSAGEVVSLLADIRDSLKNIEASLSQQKGDA
ncbi:PH domain-containing protein [Verrucomicrobiota bacterium]